MEVAKPYYFRYESDGVPVVAWQWNAEPLYETADWAGQLDPLSTADVLDIIRVVLQKLFVYRQQFLLGLDQWAERHGEGPFNLAVKQVLGG